MKNYENIFQAAKNNNRQAFRSSFFKLHLKDQEELYHALYPKNKEKIEGFLTPAEFSDLFKWMDTEGQKEVYEVFSRDYVAGLLPYMETDTVVKFLSILEEEQADELLHLQEEDLRCQIKEVMTFNPETAGSIMNKSFVIATMNETVKDVAERLRASALTVEMVYYVYVLNGEGQLCGVVSLRDLMTNPDSKILTEIMVTKLVSVATTNDQELAAKMLQAYDLIAIPVLDDAGKMKGIITVDDVMDVLTEEVTEDFHEFAAISKSDSSTNAKESVWNDARVRMPWIIILVFLGMISVSLISSFEDTLNQVVLLAAFIPIIMDSAGNVGTQSLAVAVRKLSVGDNPFSEEFWKTIWQEFLVGTIIGAAAGIVLGLIVALFYGNTILGIIIAVSLLLTLSLSNVVGSVIPVIIHKFKIDPAVASGPFITTINDALGLIIYFSIATQLLHLL